ncbi:MAG: hypothetical protein Q8K94_02595 [Moraxellaceae bacterium]|nr:hypothetical protein [Moraxellaceae bacterium]MDP1775486.1 hypothetical protein [Moraxellaceae bacterium]
MRYTRNTLLIISCLVLTACASTPSSAPIVQRHFTGHLPDSLLRELNGLQLNANVTVPVATHFSSVASLAPAYGLLLDIDPRSQTPEQAGLAIQRVLDVNTVSQQLLKSKMQQQPRLQNALRDNGRGQLSLTIRRVGILAKDVRETQCQPMMIVSADIRDNKGHLRWTSGFAMNRLDERINYSCQGLKQSKPLAQKAMTEALDAALTDAVQRMVQP